MVGSLVRVSRRVGWRPTYLRHRLHKPTTVARRATHDADTSCRTRGCESARRRTRSDAQLRRPITSKTPVRRSCTDQHARQRHGHVAITPTNASTRRPPSTRHTLRPLQPPNRTWHSRYEDKMHYRPPTNYVAVVATRKRLVRRQRRQRMAIESPRRPLRGSTRLPVSGFASY